MARAHKRLTARFVDTVKAPGRWADGGNLYLSVSPSGSRRWVFLYRWHGKPTEMGIGSVRDVSLARAREKAAEARALLADGKSPLDARRANQGVPTFGDVADEVVASLEPSWRNEKHAAQWRMTLTEYAKPLRKLRVDQVTTEDVLRVLRPVWQTKPETASRVRGRIERVLDAARAKGHRSGENPARWKAHLDTILPARQRLTRGHHAAMPYQDVPGFLERLRATPGLSALALEFAILTAARTGEVIGARPEEIDRQAKTWIVPASRMKASREHRVPLSDRALQVLDLAAELRPDGRSDFVFPGRPGQGLSNMALTMALRRTGAGEFTTHGFRSSFRDWCGEETTFPRELAEAALAHLVGDQVERAYRRGDALERRRALMDAWSEFVSGQQAGKIVRLAS